VIYKIDFSLQTHFFFENKNNIFPLKIKSIDEFLIDFGLQSSFIQSFKFLPKLD